MSAPHGLNAPHWCERYIGEPWVAGRHDCWAFFRRVQREQFGREIPAGGTFDSTSTVSCIRALRHDEERGHWLEVMEPTEGDAALLSRNLIPSHVGVWVNANGGALLHCVQGVGVILQNHASLARHGWGSIRFYRRLES